MLHSAISPLFPYTTLFRSRGPRAVRPRVSDADGGREHRGGAQPGGVHALLVLPVAGAGPAPYLVQDAGRSEEHTSELQSHVKLVCRLLLDKKNIVLGMELM